MMLVNSSLFSSGQAISISEIGIIQLAKVIIVLGLIVTGVTHAADNQRMLHRDTVFYEFPPSADDLGEHLFPEDSSKTLTRSMTLTESENQSETDKSVSMPVLFHFGKTTIVEDSRPFVDSVGEMMQKEEYATRTLIVEGHTDAVGSETSNQRLSELRALAIKEYLVTHYNIDPYRLFPTGKGESRLFKPEAPSDGKNRRVEFLAYHDR